MDDGRNSHLHDDPTLGTTVQGYVAPGFEPVRAAFKANFDAGLEAGAAFAAFSGDRCLVDLWGGMADRERDEPWTADTLNLMFSGTKGLLALCIVKLLDRGAIELDAPVVRYWPEFGKPDVLVSDVMGHSARLPGLTEPITMEQLYDHEEVVRRLERQPLFDDPRARFCYHPLTHGFLAAELVRRTDGRTVGRFFRDEIADPLGLEIWIGLPAAYESRVSTLELVGEWGEEGVLDPEAWSRDPLARAIFGNPPQLTRPLVWNEPALHAAEIPGANGIATARAMAALYAAVVAGEGRIASPEAIDRAQTLLREGFDEVCERPRRWGIGFGLQTDQLDFGPPPDAFGADGAGGSTHGAWPEQGIGFSYTMNLLLGPEVAPGRTRRLLDALHECATKPSSFQS